VEQLRDAISAVRRFELRGQTVWIGGCVRLIICRDQDASRAGSFRGSCANGIGAKRRAQIARGVDVTPPRRIVGDEPGDVIGDPAAAIGENEVLRRPAVVRDDPQCGGDIRRAIEREHRRNRERVSA
jgi:hypothetical protein